uniref:Palmitoyl-protein hydrolase n=1 Tax=Panagrolaimus sp. PS1159 TaxID=55785 RepID=A0AC35G3E4_9BILA
MDFPAVIRQRQTIIIPNNNNNDHGGVIIWFHGLGDSGQSWQETFMEHLRLPHLKIILPTAEKIPYSAQENRYVSAWYSKNVTSKILAGDEQKTFEGAVKMVHCLIREQKALGVPPKKIIVGGFGMGGGLALYAGLTCEVQIGGIACISSYIPNHKTLVNKIDANHSTPIFISIGEADTMIPVSWTKGTVRLLNETYQMSNIEFKSYPDVRHALSLEGCIDLSSWFLKCVPAPTSSGRKKRNRKNKIRH